MWFDLVVPPIGQVLRTAFCSELALVCRIANEPGFDSTQFSSKEEMPCRYGISSLLVPPIGIEPMAFWTGTKRSIH